MREILFQAGVMLQVNLFAAEAHNRSFKNYGYVLATAS